MRHQDIEPAKVRFDARRRRRDDFHPRDIQLDEPDVEPILREGVGRLAASCWIPCAEQDPVARLRDRAGDFEANAFVGARYKGHLFAR